MSKIDVRLVLLTLFNCGVVLVQILVGRKALANLFREITIRHRVTARNNLKVELLLDKGGNVSGGLALSLLLFLPLVLHTNSSTSGCDRNHWNLGFQPKLFVTQELEVSSSSQDSAGFVHHIHMVKIAVSQNNELNVVLLDEGYEVILVVNWYPYKVSYT